MAEDPERLPPGQQALPHPKVKHYGPVPRAVPQRWTMSFGVRSGKEDDAGLTGELGRLTAVGLDELPQVSATGDLHCASGWSAQGLRWEGVPTSAVLDLFPPPPGTLGVLAYAEYGYSTNVRLEDLRRPTSLLATRLDGEPLAPEHGFPVRLVVPHLYGYKSAKWFRGWEYLLTPVRGFWEERGYHLVGDPWSGERYSYME